MLKINLMPIATMVAIPMLMAGCNNTEVQFIPTTEQVREFSNNFNLSRIETNELSIMRYGYGDFNSSSNKVVPSDSINRQESLNTEFGSIETGPVNLTEIGNGTVYRFEDTENQNIYIDLIYFDDRNFRFLEVGGANHFSNPRGLVTYTGTNIFSVWGNNHSENGWGSAHSEGTFALEADFEAGRGNINGHSNRVLSDEMRSGLDGSEIEGVFSINTETGEFSGEHLQVTNIATSEVFGNVQINGSFHGERAKSVTGIYVHNPEQGESVFFGAIAGVDFEYR